MNQRFKYPIRGTRTALDSSCWGHVWAKRNNVGIDIRGIYGENLLSRLANGDCLFISEDVPLSDVQGAIESKKFPEALTEELYALADWIIDTHKRFREAPPISEEAQKELDNLRSWPIG